LLIWDMGSIRILIEIRLGALSIPSRNIKNKSGVKIEC